jgi:hypothetical protein
VPLEVGDCTGEIDFKSEPMASSIEAVPCADPHYYEVHAVIELGDQVFPGASLLTIRAKEECTTSFDAFIGIDARHSRYSSSYLAPDAGGWSNTANRRIICLAGSTRGGLTGSIKGDTSLFPKLGQCTGPQDVPLLDLQRLDCQQEHYYEVYYETPVDSAEAPTGDVLAALIDEHCKTQFTEFVGVEPADSEYEYTFFLADADNWKDVLDHRLVCTVGSSKGGIKGSLKDAKK